MSLQFPDCVYYGISKFIRWSQGGGWLVYRVQNTLQFGYMVVVVVVVVDIFYIQHMII